MNILPHWLKNHFPVKVGLFMVATLLWFLVVTERSYEYVLEIPINVERLSPDKCLAKPIVEFAGVKVQAHGKSLMRLRLISKSYLRLDLASIKDKQVIYPNTDMVEMSSGLDVVPLEVMYPDSISIVLDDYVEVQLPIRPQIRTIPTAGYTIAGHIELDPSTVLMSGPRSKISKFKGIESTPVEMVGIRRNTAVILDLILPDLFGISVIPEKVSALVRIERLGERTVVNVPIKIKNPPSRRIVVIQPSSIDVSINGGVSVIAELTKDDINVWVEYNDFHQSVGGRVKVYLDSAKPIEIIKYEPEEVKLIVRKI